MMKPANLKDLTGSCVENNWKGQSKKDNLGGHPIFQVEYNSGPKLTQC